MGPIKGLGNGELKESQKIISKRYLMTFIFSMLISISGASLLGWWLHKYHPANRQLWMVPFGLIFFCTPLVIWSSIIISGLCVKSDEEEEDGFKRNQLIHPVDDDSLCDPKRLSLAL